MFFFLNFNVLSGRKINVILKGINVENIKERNILV